MSRYHVLLLLLGLFAALVWVDLPASSQAQTSSLPGAGLMGIVKSSDGKPREGVPVSAKAEGSTITAAVYTSENGEYYFPPIKDGHYRIWRQAVRFGFKQPEHAAPSGQKL